jgi:hypothetical protein
MHIRLLDMLAISLEDGFVFSVQKLACYIHMQNKRCRYIVNLKVANLSVIIKISNIHLTANTYKHNHGLVQGQRNFKI